MVDKYTLPCLIVCVLTITPIMLMTIRYNIKQAKIDKQNKLAKAGHIWTHNVD